MTWVEKALHYAVRPSGQTTNLIKGEAELTPDDGLVPGFSASGQDVWLPAAQYRSPGLVLSAVGARCGKVFLADFDAWGVVANTSVLLPEPGHSLRFLWYLLNCDHIWVRGGAAQPYVRVPESLQRRHSIPAVETQHRIADMLDTETARIDTLVKKNDQVIGLLAARAARVLEDEIFNANARPVGIHYLATYVNGFPFKPEDRSDEGTPIVRIAQLLGDTREQDFYAGTPDAYCHIDSGDLIFSWSATLAAKIWEGGPAFLNQHLFKVEPHEHVDRDWLLRALNATVPRMKALTHGSTMTHITRPMMTKIRVPKPSLPEQRIIAERIAVRFAQLDALRARIGRQQELLRLRRQALITAAVAGQIEV